MLEENNADRAYEKFQYLYNEAMPVKNKNNKLIIKDTNHG